MTKLVQMNRALLNHSNRTVVIAVSGASGCGKTTLIKNLAKYFHCPYLLFDDYIDKNTYANNMEHWFNQGANVCLIKTPRFIEAIALIKNSKNDHTYLFIEEPFGKQRDSISPLIDYVILLDIPLETCLKRIINRNNSNVEMTHYMEKYESYFKEIYVHTVELVRHNCDHVFNETISPRKTAIKISQWLERNAIRR